MTACLFAGVLLISCPARVQADEVFVTIGGGDFFGVYFPTGLAISKILNKKRQVYGIRATVEATPGSTFNLNAIMAGYMDLGLTQADKEYHAVKGLAEWSDKGPQDELRTIFSLYTETVTLVAAVDAGIGSIQDLKGKRVSIGNPGSSQHRLVTDIIEAVGLDPEKDIISQTVFASEAPSLLQDNHIDAYFFIVGHPSETIRMGLSSERKAQIIPILGPDIDKLVAKNTYYTKTTIHTQQLYPGVEGVKEDIETVGVKALLCTSVKVSDNVVYAVTKEVFGNLDDFRKQHPALMDLNKEDMLKGISAPVHPGALKYYKEIGLAR